MGMSTRSVLLVPVGLALVVCCGVQFRLRQGAAAHAQMVATRAIRDECNSARANHAIPERTWIPILKIHKGLDHSCEDD